MKTENLKNYKISGEDFYEWEIIDWNKINKERLGSEFQIANHKW